MTIVVTIILTAVAVVLLLNLTTGERKIERQITPDYAVGDPQFCRSMGALLGPALVNGGRVFAYQNGDEIFPAMLEAIKSARRTITFETYIYWSGDIGAAFADALSERARAGVRVHVMLDWVGTGKMDNTLVDSMREAGVEVFKFHPLRWYTLARINNRTHRKLLVVDGLVGFTGGVGIADVWQGHAQDPHHWRDSHYRLEGPAVYQMQAAFMDNWMKTRALVLDGEHYFPALDGGGEAKAQVFVSSRDEGSESVRLMYLLSIAAARKSIRISASYFVPDALVTTTLVKAAQRGVQIELIVPGPHSDHQAIRHASRAKWGPLLQHGVAIYEYQPTMYHCKVMIVDDLWTSVGSTNFDNRSFRLNAEANLNVLDRHFAEGQSRVFDEDREKSKRVTYEAWRKRPLKERVVAGVISVLESQL